MTRTLPLLLLTLSACSAGPVGTLPSLLPRPRPVAPPAPVATPDRAIAAQADAIVARARVAAAAFARLVPARAPIIRAGAGAPLGSEAWARASLARGELLSARQVIAGARADLDALRVASMTVGTADLEALDRAEAAIAAMIGGADASIG